MFRTLCLGVGCLCVVVFITGLWAGCLGVCCLILLCILIAVSLVCLLYLYLCALCFKGLNLIIALRVCLAINFVGLGFVWFM